MSAPLPVGQVEAAITAPHRRVHRGVITKPDKEAAGLVPLASLYVPAWDALASHAIEPNGCYLPDWSLAIDTHADGRGGALALAAFDPAEPGRLRGLMPVRWARNALSLPLPLLVSWNAYAPYSVPLLDRDAAVAAADALIDTARTSGARGLLLQTIATEGPAYAALLAALELRGLRPKVVRSFRRAGLDARQNPDAVLRDALSAKKLKELRRQRNRLEDEGPVSFEVADTPERIGPALEAFLALEAKGWKGTRGTALAQHAGDATFIRTAAPALAARGQFAVVRLVRGSDTLAAGLILREGGRAFFFKIAMDETVARLSPGVQLTLDLTTFLCADPAVHFADSAADAESPMIDHIWRERITIADVFVPLSPRDPFAAALHALIAARTGSIKVLKRLRRIKEKLS
jgi:CelD/BcsL family acetyltransferase involved in cellulose biosynthesis